MAGTAGLNLAFGVIGANFNWEDPRKMNAGRWAAWAQIVTMLYLPVAFAAFVSPGSVGFLGLPIAYGYLAGLLFGVGITAFSAYIPLWLVRRKVERLGEEPKASLRSV